MAFIGMRVPAETAAEFARIAVPGDREPPEKMHVTLAYLGEEYDLGEVLRAIGACIHTGAQHGPMELTAAAVTCFPPDPEGKTPVVARIVTPALFAMRQALVEKLDLERIVYSKRHPQFKPHVTLAYAQGPQKPTPIQPVRWPAGGTVWGGDNGEDILSAEIQLRGGS